MENCVEANDYRIKMGSKTRMYHVNMLKKYIAREPEVDMVHTSNKDVVTIAVARVMYQDSGPELGKYQTDVFTDMPGETDVIQHRVKLIDDTLIRCKPYPLLKS